MKDELDRLIDTARNWLGDGHGVAIATVIETWGSAPRRRGSHALIRDDGLFEGSVSGGCVEGDLLLRAQEIAVSGGFERRDYGVADDSAWQVGLACGGEISVFVQAIADNAFAPALIDRIAVARAGGRELVLSTDLATGVTREGEAEGAFVNVYPPRLRMMIVGAVHIAQALVPLATIAGFQPLIVDPRDGFAASARFEAIAVDTRWSDEALADWRIDSGTAVITLTHDPKIDDPALIAALDSDAFYIASLGSRRTHAKRRERLAAAGFDEAAIDRVQGPAGLSIGAVNPAEIAVSILAGTIAALRKPRA
ncbi:XdhC family protein [Sphingomonas montanisoli]|uniref:XdhC family protein n=1 Tax=Sphingomonas montanisoli TaxID=2606412 RepID=A0A5D9C7B8_9SPHN|nr:XdhC family protein [Sphingomonas montanisoli]TZG27768.1 XdhC family protein [Sphingomonas montanisoli]